LIKERKNSRGQVCQVTVTVTVTHQPSIADRQCAPADHRSSGPPLLASSSSLSLSLSLSLLLLLASWALVVGRAAYALHCALLPLSLSSASVSASLLLLQSGLVSSAQGRDGGPRLELGHLEAGAVREGVEERQIPLLRLTPRNALLRRRHNGRRSRSRSRQCLMAAMRRKKRNVSGQ
jgi:hypothetical protein